MAENGLLESLAATTLGIAQLFLAFVGIAALLYVAFFVLAEVRAVLGKGSLPVSAAVPAVLTRSTKWVPTQAPTGTWTTQEVEQ